MFNLHRFGYFLRLNLYLQRKLLMWLAGGVLVLFLTFTSFPSDDQIFTAMLYISGIIITSSAFTEIHDRNLAIQALTLPLSSLERYLALWFLTGPLYFLALLVLCVISIGVHLLFGYVVWESVPGMGLALLQILLQYLTLNAFFLLGSVVFKRLVLLKTGLCLFAVALLLEFLKHHVGNGVLHPVFVYQNTLYFWSPLAFICACFGYYRLTKIELK